jgi:predicted Zn-dependent peptidase
MSSRLFQRIREERGLVYGIHCFNTAYADGGLFGIYAGTGEDDLAELVPAVCEEFAGVADTLTEGELVRARNQIKAGTLMALESSGARSEQAARHLIIHGRPIPYAEIVTRIEAVDQAAVRRVAQRLLQGELTLAALGPIDELEPLDKIAARLAA